MTQIGRDFAIDKYLESSYQGFMMDAFETAEKLLDEIQEHYEYCDYENILPLLDRVHEVMKNCHVEFFHIYFNGNLNAVREFAEDLMAPSHRKIWPSFRAREYALDHLYRTRAGLGMMKQNFVPA